MVGQVPWVAWTTFFAVAAAAGAQEQSASHAAPRVLEAVAPRYPPQACQGHVVGRIRVEITILPNGSVGTVRSDSGGPLSTAAESAARRWRFEPAPEGAKAVLVFAFTCVQDSNPELASTTRFRLPDEVEVICAYRPIVVN